MVIFLVIIALVILYVISVYNNLIRGGQQIKEAWATIETQLKRRYDLIPNLVEVVKGYAKHEKSTLENVIKARNSAMQSTSVSGKEKAEAGLAGALKSVFALSEQYPTLLANENFKALQQELSDTETKIQAARQFYNTVVMDFNTRLQVFPSNLIAGWFHFERAKFFRLEDDEAKKAHQSPQVKFD